MNIIDTLWKYKWLKRDTRCSIGMTKQEYNILFSLLTSTKTNNINICEIGVAGGSSCALWASYIKQNKGKLYVVDEYKNENSKEWKIVFFKNMLNLGLIKYINLLEMESKEARDYLRNKNFKFDLIFIDGDHHYEAVKRDIELWYPLVKEKGILCGHDCERILTNKEIKKLKKAPNLNTIDVNEYGHIGVNIAVSEKFKNKVKQKERIWWITK